MKFFNTTEYEYEVSREEKRSKHGSTEKAPRTLLSLALVINIYLMK